MFMHQSPPRHQPILATRPWTKHVPLAYDRGYVIFETADPGVTVSSEATFYAIFACMTFPASGRVELASSIAPGTIVKVTARVGMLGQDCPDAYAIDIPIEVH
jgi:hypothetical protein